MARRDTNGDALGVGAKALLDGLSDGLQGLEAGPSLRSVNPHSQVQWSTAANTLALPSPVVTVSVMSVPHMTLGSAAMMVPSWTLGLFTTAR